LHVDAVKVIATANRMAGKNFCILGILSAGRRGARREKLARPKTRFPPSSPTRRKAHKSIVGRQPKYHRRRERHAFTKTATINSVAVDECAASETSVVEQFRQKRAGFPEPVARHTVRARDDGSRDGGSSNSCARSSNPRQNNGGQSTRTIP
jgi:hypothetical protein